jgi:hypothetical protein
MNAICKTALWRQFGAAIDMFENALRSCPDGLWTEPLWNDPQLGTGLSEYWYVAYHALFWLDLYLAGTVDGFTPPAPFDLNELDLAGLLPERQFTRDELLAYLEYNRRKCRITIRNLTDKQARQVCTFPWAELSYLELLLDNLRHVQEHAAQLSMLLGQKAGSNAGWVARTKNNLEAG